MQHCFDQCRAKDDRFSAQNLKYFGDQLFLLGCIYVKPGPWTGLDRGLDWTGLDHM